MRVLHSQMLSVPTLWTAFVINFLALGLIWAYVARSYPKLEAARFWTGSAFAAAIGASSAVVSREFGWIAACCSAAARRSCLPIWLAAMGMQRFYGRPVAWRSAALVTAATLAVLAVLHLRPRQCADAGAGLFAWPKRLPLVARDQAAVRRHDGRAHPGARLAGTVAALILAMFAVRAVGQLARRRFRVHPHAARRCR